MTTQLLTELAHFRCSEQFFRHPMFRDYVYTEGVQYLAEQAGAYWLLDHIIAHQHEPAVRTTRMQVWKIRVQEDKSAEIHVEDGNDQVVYSSRLEFTDFPLTSFTLWFMNSTLLLPSEY